MRFNSGQLVSTKQEKDFAMPKISEQFLVNQPAEQVWKLMSDIPAVVSCMPGLKYLGQTDSGAHRGEMKVRLGPVAAAFTGEAEITEIDNEKMRTSMKSKATDKIGGNRASSVLTYWLDAVDEGTMVYVECDVKLTGALAQMGRTGIFMDVASRLTGQFADGLRTKLVGSGTEFTAAEETNDSGEFQAGGVLFSAIRKRIKRFFASVTNVFRTG